MRIVLIIVFAAAALASSGATERRASFMERIADARRKGTGPAGGYVVKIGEGKVIAVRDKQSTYSEGELAAVVQYACRVSKRPFVLAGPDYPGDKVGAEVVLVDEIAGERKTGVLAAPEDGWAKLAVGRLVADKPDDALRQKRLRLELLRAGAMSVGLGVSMFQPCLMARVSSLSDIDAIRMGRFCPEAENNFDESAKRLGLGRAIVKGYYTACQEGWAPAPTNDVQKAIWDKVHEVPAKPMKIEFDPKKGK